MAIRMAPGRLAASSSGRLSQPDVTRSNKQAAGFYQSPEWKAFRNQLIKERGWRCEEPKCGTPRGPWRQVYGHHVVELADGGAPLDRRNTLLVCGVCHGRLTQENKRKRAAVVRPIG